jgi:hypothetical protein
VLPSCDMELRAVTDFLSRPALSAVMEELNREAGQAGAPFQRMVRHGEYTAL